jgi:hypothetical protein
MEFVIHKDSTKILKDTPVVEFPGLEWNPLFLSEDWLGAVGHPSRRAGRGSAVADRVGKGRVFPACEPDRVTAEAVK